MSDPNVVQVGGSPASSNATHEALIYGIREIAISRLNDEESCNRLRNAKVTYGSGPGGLRGICYYEAWQNGSKHDFIELCASGEESNVQLIGTSLHELAHSLAGWKAGHGPKWKLAAKTLGLIRAEAAGQKYSVEDFAPDFVEQVTRLPLPADGCPAFGTDNRLGIAPPTGASRPCPLGTGTRGGKSRGKGSGSRLRLYVCRCQKPLSNKVRIASDNFRAKCLNCGSEFLRVNPA